MGLLHSRLPTSEATKSIYDDTDTTDKYIKLCDYQRVLLFHDNYKFSNVKKRKQQQQKT